MEVGTGIAVAGVSFAALGALYRLVPPRECSGKHCQDHSGVMEALKNINGWMKTLDGKMDQVLRNGRGQ